MAKEVYLNRDHFSGISKYIFFLSLAAGSEIRLYSIWKADFVIHDGGMFYTMIRDIQASNYALPTLTTYNHAHIPFAYPPLMFYVVAILNSTFHISILSILRWLPALIGIFTIPIFYLLANELIKPKIIAGLSTFFYALAPKMISTQIMGGGITRSAGALFTLLFLFFFYRSLTQKTSRPLIGASVSGALVVISHPEWTLHAIIAGFVFWIWFGRSRSNTVRAGAILFLILLLTSPWWGLMLTRFGIAPYISAPHAAEGFSLIEAIKINNATNEVVPLLLILAPMGAFLALFSPFKFLAFWLFADFILEPRGALRTAPVEMAMLTAYLCYTFYSWVSQPKHKKKFLIPGRVLIGAIMGIAFFNGFVIGVQLYSYHVLSTADQNAFAWIQSNTPQSSRFLVFTPQSLFHAPAKEWFPALTGRQSLLTIQGTEWLTDPQKHFIAKIQQNENIQQCKLATPDCLEAWSAEFNLPFDYVYTTQAFSNLKRQTESLSLNKVLIASSNFQLVYDTPEVKIFKKINRESHE